MKSRFVRFQAAGITFAPDDSIHGYW